MKVFFKILYFVIFIAACYSGGYFIFEKIHNIWGVILAMLFGALMGWIWSVVDVYTENKIDSKNKFDISRK